MLIEDKGVNCNLQWHQCNDYANERIGMKC